MLPNMTNRFAYSNVTPTSQQNGNHSDFMNGGGADIREDCGLMLHNSNGIGNDNADRDEDGGMPIVRSQHLPPGSRSIGASNVLTTATHSKMEQRFGEVAGRTLDNWGEWAATQYKCGVQSAREKLLGQPPITRDPATHTEIDRLRNNRREIKRMFRQSVWVEQSMQRLVESQREMATSLRELEANDGASMASERFATAEQTDAANRIQQQLAGGASIQLHLVESGRKLLVALHHFNGELYTFLSKTLEDTMITVRKFEKARLLFDTQKLEVAAKLAAHGDTADTGQSRQQTGQTGQTRQRERTGDSMATRRHSMKGIREIEAEQKCDKLESNYEKLKRDVAEKIFLVQEHKNRLLRQHLVLFYRAVSNYHAGDVQELDKCLKQFHLGN